MSLNAFIFLVGLIFGFWFVRKGINQLVDKIGEEKKIDLKRTHYVKAVINFATFLIFLTVGSVVLGIDYSHIAIFFSSAFAVIGVAFFAQWSILSNVTASIIVYFFFPYKVGDIVKIVDGENTISGRIYEITLFHVLMREANGEIITYPNSLVFQKAVIINPINHASESVEISKTNQDGKSDSATMLQPTPEDSASGTIERAVFNDNSDTTKSANSMTKEAKYDKPR